MAKMTFPGLLAVLIAGCGGQDEPPAPAPKTGQPHSGVYAEQVNALGRAEQLKATTQQAEELRRQQLEQAGR